MLGITVWGLALGQALLITGNILLVSVTALIGLNISHSPALALSLIHKFTNGYRYDLIGKIINEV